MDSFDINQLKSLLGNVDKKDLEKAVIQANKIMNSKNKDNLINELKNKLN